MNDYDPLEQLALLSPKSIDLRHIPSSYSRLTPQDVCFKLARCSREASLLGRYKYAGILDLKNTLEGYLAAHIAGNRILTAEHCRKKPLLYILTEVALSEVCDHHVCSQCRGRGQFPETYQEGPQKGQETGRIFVCRFCGGEGKKRWSEAGRARKLGIHPQEWLRSTSKRTSYSQAYSDTLEVLYRWEQEVREALI